MDKIKVNDFVTAYSKAIGLNDEYKDVLLELMLNIISKYEKIVPYISVSDDPSEVYAIKAIDGKYSTEDFFLNRLMRNVWDITAITPDNIADGLADKNTKGQYDKNNLKIDFNLVQLENQLHHYKKILGSNYEKNKEIAVKKVIMHEFEHALQTRFDNKIDNRYSILYKKIFDEIHKIKDGKYSPYLKQYKDLNEQPGDYSHYIFTGTHYSSTVDSNIKTYRNVEGFDLLNEVLNETECLEMANQQLKLYEKYNDSGNAFILRNPESSNSEITNYGNLLKLVLGESSSFTLMYINPSEILEKFNTVYGDIFKEIYNSDKDAIEIIMTCLNDIKNTKSEEKHLKLNYALSKCLERKIDKFYDDNNITNEQMKLVVDKFFESSIVNHNESKSNNLEHIKVINNLKDKIKNRGLDNVEKNQTEEVLNYVSKDKNINSDIQKSDTQEENNNLNREVNNNQNSSDDINNKLTQIMEEYDKIKNNSKMLYDKLKEKIKLFRSANYSEEEKSYETFEINSYEMGLHQCIDNENDLSRLLNWKSNITTDLENNELEQSLANRIMNSIDNRINQLQKEYKINNNQNSVDYNDKLKQKKEEITKKPNNTEETYNKLIDKLKELRINTNYSEEQKLNLTSEIYDYEFVLIKCLNDENDLSKLLNLKSNIPTDLENNEFERLVVNGVIYSINSRINQLQKGQETNSDFKQGIDKLKKNLESIKREYQKMFLDGMIDDDELQYLIIRIKNLIRDCDDLKNNCSNNNEVTTLDELKEIIETQLQKMKICSNELEDIISGFRY